MNFMEAVKAMKEGKKVKRSSGGCIHRINGNIIVWKIQGTSIQTTMNIEDFEATDWEVVENKKCKECGQKLEYYEDKAEYCLPCFDKKKTLSNKVLCNMECLKRFNLPFYQEEDVKEAIKELMDGINNTDFKEGTSWKFEFEEYKKQAKEIFGDRLI